MNRYAVRQHQPSHNLNSAPLLMCFYFISLVEVTASEARAGRFDKREADVVLDFPVIAGWKRAAEVV